MGRFRGQLTLDDMPGPLLVVVSGERIAAVCQGARPSIPREAIRIDGRGKYLLPGFIDSHIHVESSMLPPAEFARMAVVHGTVAAVTDPHEIANVLGVEGVRYMIEVAIETRHTPRK